FSTSSSKNRSSPYNPAAAASDSPLSTICKSRRHAATELKRTLKEPLVPSCETTRSEQHTSELQSRFDLVCRLLLEKKKRTRRPSWTGITPARARSSAVNASGPQPSRAASGG